MNSKLGKTADSEKGPSKEYPPGSPWPEWNDTVINATVWDPRQARRNKSAKSTKMSTRAIRTQSGATVAPLEPQIDTGFVEGEEYIPLPSGMRVSVWRRASTLGSEPFLGPEPYPTDLLTANQHLLQYPIMREVICAVKNLEELAMSRYFGIEGTSLKFIPNFECPWKPWFHIYSKTRAGRGSVHRSQYNPYGLYIVRLFHMGYWRMICVDDLVPLDDQDRMLLPVSTIPGCLWLPLLTKAIVRAAAVSPPENFSVIASLTGWIPINVNLERIDSSSAWSLLCHHMLPVGHAHPEEVPHCPANGPCPVYEHLPYARVEGATFVFANLNPKGELPGVIGEQTVVIRRLIRYIESPEKNERWRKERWVPWALRNGVVRTVPGQFVERLELCVPLVELPPPQPPLDSEPSQLSNIVTHLSPLVPHPYAEEEVKITPVTLLKFNFSGLFKYLRQLVLMYVPSRFLHSTMIYDITASMGTINIPPPPPSAKEPVTARNFRSAKNDAGKSVSGAGQHRPPPVIMSTQTYRPVREEPYFFIFTDSEFCKELVVTLEAEDANTYLIVESYCWKTVGRPPVLASLRPGCAAHIPLQPGRQVMKVWFHLPSQYLIGIFSQSQFHVCSRHHLFELSSQESRSLIAVAGDVASNFRKLMIQIPGSPEHGKALDDLTNALLPFPLRPLHMRLGQIPSPNKLIEDSILELLTNEFQDVDLIEQTLTKFAVIFQNPKFGEEPLLNWKNLQREEIGSGDGPTVPSEVSYSKKSVLTEPSKIMKKKTGVQVKAVDRQRSMLFLDELDGACSFLRILGNKEMKLLELFPFGNDQNYTIAYQDYVGSFSLNEQQSITIACLLLCNIHSLTSVPVLVQFMVTAPPEISGGTRVELINLDTLEPILSDFDVSPTFYIPRSQNGYMLIGYFYPKEAKRSDLIYKLRIGGISDEDILHQCSLPLKCPAPNLLPTAAATSSTIDGFYFIPPSSNILKRFLLKICDDEVVTIQAWVSQPHASLILRIYDVDGLYLTASGQGRVTIPAAPLSFEKSVMENNDFYYIGELVLEPKSSWLLSHEEKNVLSTIKDIYNPFENIPEAIMRTVVNLNITNGYSNVSTGDDSRISHLRPSIRRSRSSRGMPGSGMNRFQPAWAITMTVTCRQKNTCADLLHDKRAFVNLVHAMADRERRETNPKEKSLDCRQRYLSTLVESPIVTVAATLLKYSNKKPVPRDPKFCRRMEEDIVSWNIENETCLPEKIELERPLFEIISQYTTLAGGKALDPSRKEISKSPWKDHGSASFGSIVSSEIEPNSLIEKYEQRMKNLYIRTIKISESSNKLKQQISQRKTTFIIENTPKVEEEVIKRAYSRISGHTQFTKVPSRK